MRGCTLFALLVCVAGSAAQDLPGDKMIETYLAAETDRLSQKVLDGATNLQEWQARRPRLQREYLDMLGLWPLPEKTPLHATVTGQLEKHGVIVEKLHYQSKPGLYVTANLYRPQRVDKKLPAILYVCGHSGRGRDGNKTAFQDHGFWFANNGYVCLIVDTLQLGEIAALHHGTYGIRKGKDQTAETRFWWHSAGYTPAGVECWNGVRGIDYLLTRPEVDPERIGVTGISGGGAATFWIAAADERVKVAVPVSGMSDLESYVKNKVVNGHCDCMFLYNMYQWEWTTIAALVAPRPLLFANSDNDRIFPMDGNRRIIARLRQLYAMYGKSDLVDEYVSKGGHDYRPDLRIAVFKFINKHLKGDTSTPVEDSERYAALPGKELRVFPEDSDIPKDQLNTRADEVFVPRAKVELPEEGKFAEWKRRMITKLRETSFYGMPERFDAARLQRLESPALVLLGRSAGRYETEPKIEVLQSQLAKATSDKGQCVLLCLDDRDVAVKTEGSTSAFALQPRGFGNGWARKSPPNYVERSHVLLGRTVDAGRVWDVAAIARGLGTRHKDVRVMGDRELGIIAAYAAILEPSITEVVVFNPPKSHLEGPHFLGVLRVLDIPDALGLLAPTPLTIIGSADPAFDRTAEIYRRAGAADKFIRK